MLHYRGALCGHRCILCRGRIVMAPQSPYCAKCRHFAGIVQFLWPAVTWRGRLAARRVRGTEEA